MGFEFVVEGGDALSGLELALKRLPYHLTEDVHVTALKKAAIPVKQRMADIAPYDTGLLEKDLRIAKSRFKRIDEYQVIVGYRKTREGHGKIAHILEYGSVKYRATRFMKKSDEQTRYKQDQIYTKEIQFEVDKRIDGL